MIKLEENIIIVDVKAAMSEGLNITKDKIKNAALNYTVDNANSLYDLRNFDGKVSYVNKPEMLSIEEASESMSLSEFKEINKLASESEDFIDNLKYATSLRIIDDKAIRTVVRREYPQLIDEEFDITMSHARNIWRMDSDWVQNVAELIELASELKKVNK